MWLAVVAALVAAMGFVIRWAQQRKGLESPSWQEIYPEGPWRYLFWAALGLSLAHFVQRTGGAFRLWRDYRGRSVASAASKLPVQTAVKQVQLGVLEALGGREADIPRALDEIFRGALVTQASDIHFNPGAQQLTVHYRVDGVIHESVRITDDLARRLVSRIKVLAHLDAYDQRPQDGTLRRQVGEVGMEARVSTLPSNYGERVVLRIVRSTETVPLVEELGFDSQVSKQLLDLLKKPQGMIYVSGPVGSGKTTTLYSALREVHLARGEITSLVSLEDPIELQLPFVTQTQINSKTGLDFAAALRSVLRQDPGAIMLGEIRDRETAEIATQAGLTGHLILTTIHVESASATFDRLLDLDVEPYVLTSSCLGCLAQRLVRRLCPNCKQQKGPAEHEREALSRLGLVVSDFMYFSPGGCEACERRGYLGRIPVAELLVMSEPIRAAIGQGASRRDVEAIACHQGMVPLARVALQLAQRGETSLAEVIRVTG